MAARKTKAVADKDNPEWTAADFAKAKPAADVLPADVLAKFGKTRGPQRTPTKIPVSVRLDPRVVTYFKAKGPGWQTKIDEALKKIAGVKDTKPRKRA
jgi:uncharacterized protein (DUF4415 family)